jgi:hypothetical protein
MTVSPTFSNRHSRLIAMRLHKASLSDLDTNEFHLVNYVHEYMFRIIRKYS